MFPRRSAIALLSRLRDTLLSNIPIISYANNVESAGGRVSLQDDTLAEGALIRFAVSQAVT